MSRSIFAILIVLTLAPSIPALAQSKPQTSEQVVKDKLKPLPDKAAELFSEEGELENSAAAAILLKETIGGIPGVDLNDESFHCIIHVAKWEFEDQDVTDETKKIRQNLKNQHWYVYQGGGNFDSGEEFSARRRIWGSKRVWLVYVHLDSRLADRYTPAYVVSLTKKNPANLQALMDILGLFKIAQGEPELAPKTYNYWGGAPLEMKGWTESDISVLPAVSVKQVVKDAAGNILTTDPAAISQVKLGEAVSFDNEGRHRWDAGIGVPIRRATDLKFDSETGVATPAKVDKTSVLAMISVYPYPVDIKSNASLAIPHLVFGVDVSDHPLNEIFVGGGWGPVFANFYFGGSYVKLTDRTDGKTHEWQATMGVLMKVRGIIDKLK